MEIANFISYVIVFMLLLQASAGEDWDRGGETRNESLPVENTQQIHDDKINPATLNDTSSSQTPDYNTDSHRSDSPPSDAAVEEEDVKIDDEETPEQLVNEQWRYDKHGILLLNRDNFDAAIDKFDFLLVNFYTPSCSQCVLLHPHYVQAWQQLQQANTEAQLAMIDCSNETALLKHYGIVQFPTITFFKYQQEKMYDGGYRVNDLVTWVSKRLGPPAVPVTNVETLETALKQHRVVVVGFFADANSTSVVLYRYVADVIHDYPFFITSEQAVFEHFNVTSDKVVVFKQFDERRVEMDGTKFKADELADFLRLETLPLLVSLGMDNVWTITDDHHPIKTHLLLFINAIDQNSSDTMYTSLSSVAQSYKGQIIFVLVNASDARMLHMMEFFGVSPAELPVMRIFRYDGAPAFKYRPEVDVTANTDDESNEQTKEEFSAEKVDRFCSDFLGGRLKPFRLGQPVKPDWHEGDVIDLVADNYNRVTSGSDELVACDFVFVMLYAPWCGHCQRQMPEFQRAAHLYVEHKQQLRFARMDATGNEVEHLEVTSYPTYLLYRTSQTDNTTSGKTQDDLVRQSPIRCNDSHTTSEFLEFLNEYTTVKLDIEAVNKQLYVQETVDQVHEEENTSSSAKSESHTTVNNSIETSIENDVATDIIADETNDKMDDRQNSHHTDDRSKDEL